MTLVLTREQVRAVDRRAIEHYGMHSLVLMENAGRGVVDLLEQQGIGGPVVILCGRGNNGGDGFVIARHLLLRGHSAIAVVFDPEDSLSDDARANYEILRRGGAPLVAVASEEAVGPLEDILRPADWIVDALLGTGARGRPRSPYDEAIRQANRAAARRLAVDWPSGLDCDTGEASGDSTFRADVTATFVALKPAATRPETQAWTGAVHVISIGILPCVVDDITRGDL